MTGHFFLYIGPHDVDAVLNGAMTSIFANTGCCNVGDRISVVVRFKDRSRKPELVGRARCKKISRIIVDETCMYLDNQRLTRDQAEKVIADFEPKKKNRMGAGESVPDYFLRRFGSPTALPGGHVKFDSRIVYWDSLEPAERKAAHEQTVPSAGL